MVNKKAKKPWFLICYHFKSFSVCGPYVELNGVIDGGIIDCDRYRGVEKL